MNLWSKDNLRSKVNAHLQSKWLEAAKLQQSSVQFLRVLLSLFSVGLSRLHSAPTVERHELWSITQAGRADSMSPCSAQHTTPSLPGMSESSLNDRLSQSKHPVSEKPHILPKMLAPLIESREEEQKTHVPASKTRKKNTGDVQHHWALVLLCILRLGALRGNMLLERTMGWVFILYLPSAKLRKKGKAPTAQSASHRRAEL